MTLNIFYHNIKKWQPNLDFTSTITQDGAIFVRFTCKMYNLRMEFSFSYHCARQADPTDRVTAYVTQRLANFFALTMQHIALLCILYILAGSSPGYTAWTLNAEKCCYKIICLFFDSDHYTYNF